LSDSGRPFTILLFSLTYWLINSTDPIPKKYGTAWVVEGQYRFYPAGNFKGHPCFRPVDPITCYRWKPTNDEIKKAKQTGKALSSFFEAAKARGEVKIIEPTETILIHRSWGNSSMNSAGCQVFADNTALNRLYKWALLHKDMYKNTPLIYTLLTKTQFVVPNQNSIVSPMREGTGVFLNNASLDFLNFFKR
jgi:hypothetical protein